MITIQNLTKEYKSNKNMVTALEDISVSIPRGSFVSVVGMSGSGKTTLLKILTGIDTKYSGSITVDNNSLDEYLSNHNVALVSQCYSSFEWMTVAQNVHEGNPSLSETEVNEMVRQVGLYAFKDSYLKELSGGMKQRVAVARALVQDTEIIVLDEPFGALDIQTRYKIGGLLSTIAKRSNKTVVLVTHNIDDAVRLSDRVVVMGNSSLDEDIQIVSGEEHLAEERIRSCFI